MVARERFSWVFMVTTAVAMAGYALAAARWHAQLGPVARIGLLAVPLGLMGVVSLAAWLLDRPEQADERDLAIESRATRVAYNVLLAGFLYAGMVMPFTQWGWDIVHTSLAAVVLAELVRCGLVVWGYRKASHE